jgi:IS30 family transposase
MRHWEFDTVIGTSRKGAIVTMVECKSGHGIIATVTNKRSELVRSAIVDKLNPMAAQVKTLTFDSGKKFAGHVYIDEKLQSTAYFARSFASWERSENLNACCADMFQKYEQCLPLQMRKLE